MTKVRHEDKKPVLLFYGGAPGEREFTEEELALAIGGMGAHARAAVRATICRHLSELHVASLDAAKQGTHEVTMANGGQEALIELLRSLEELAAQASVILAAQAEAEGGGGAA